MLLARREGQHEAALAIFVFSLAHQTAGNLPDEFFFGGQHSRVGPTESERHAERLRFHGDNIGFTGRLHDTQRKRFGNRDHQQRTFAVHQIGNCRNVFNRAKEVRRLNQDTSGISADLLLQIAHVHAAIFEEIEFGNRQTLMLRIGMHHLAVFRVYAARHQGRFSSGNADRHHDGLGRTG